MDEVIGISVLIVLLALKIVLMRAVWKMAGTQGKSQWLCLIASAFAALIVFLALWISGREKRHWEQLEAESATSAPESKSAVE